MSTQSEAVLEKNLIKQLVGLEYGSVKIPDDSTLFSTKQMTSSLSKTKSTMQSTSFGNGLNTCVDTL